MKQMTSREMNKNKTLPTVSFIIVARNAANHLPAIFTDLSHQDYPKSQIEVILVDGRSADNSPLMMKKYARENPDLDVKVLDNPGKILASGWNVALRQAKGEIILRVDAHTEIPGDFISKNVSLILRGEDIVGGPVITKALDGPFKGLVSNVEVSKFGGGGADFRNPGPPRYVDTLAFAAYKRDVFKKVGGYDERLVRTEDNEIHHRMQEAGYKFFFNPDVKSYRVPRASLWGLLVQKYASGLWIGLTLGVSPKCFGLRHFVPAFFLISLIFTAILAFTGNPLPMVFLGTAYFSGYALLSIKDLELTSSLKNQLASSLLPFVFPLIHFAYGAGTLIGLIRTPLFAVRYRDYEIPTPVR